MSFESTIKREGIKHLPIDKNIRKRFLVSQGELFQLYKEITLIRAKEDRERLMADFKALLKDAQEVELKVKDKKGGSHE